MGIISVEGIRVYAYHGHLPEEAVLGGHFIVVFGLRLTLQMWRKQIVYKTLLTM